MRLALVLLLAGISASAGAQSVYRCTINGRAVFQDRPCAAAPSEKVDVRPGAVVNPGGDRPEGTPWDAYLQQVEQDKAVQAEKLSHARAAEQRNIESMRGKVMVGMTTAQVRRAWGAPSTINRSSYGSEQWVYRSGRSKAQYVYVEDGVVTAWQD